MSTRRTIVIGAGPAGLVSLKTTLHFAGERADSPRPFDPICFEASDAIGGTFDQVSMLLCYWSCPRRRRRAERARNHARPGSLATTRAGTALLIWDVL